MHMHMSHVHVTCACTCTCTCNFALHWQVFYREIVLSSLHPLSGPREGGTAITWQVVDSANGTDYRCRFFGATALAGGESRANLSDTGLQAACVTPNKTYAVPLAAPPPPPPQMVEVVDAYLTKNGQNFALVPLNYTYYPQPTIRLYDPPGGRLGGNTTVTLFGTFPGGSEYVCRYGTFVVPATYGGAATNGTGDELLVCSSPNVTAADVAVGANGGHPMDLSISLNNQQFDLAGPFTFYGDSIFESMVPLSGPDLGGTRVVIQGPNLAPDFAPELLAAGLDGVHQYFCRFGQNPKVRRAGPARLLVARQTSSRHQAPAPSLAPWRSPSPGCQAPAQRQA